MWHVILYTWNLDNIINQGLSFLKGKNKNQQPFFGSIRGHRANYYWNNTRINSVSYILTTVNLLLPFPVFYVTLYIQIHFHIHSFIINIIISLYSWFIDNMHIFDTNIYVYILCIYLHNIYKYVLQVIYNIKNTWLYICYNTNGKYS